MRLLLPLLISIGASTASRYGRLYDDWRDYRWSYGPERDAYWYKKVGAPLPELAPAVTTVEENKSYVVKLECVGCPFRVRPYMQSGEYWQEPPQDNSLLLNFTIDDNESTLLLDDKSILPINLPLRINAFQTPANLSAEIMGKMVSFQMLEKSWKVGTKYGNFEMQYDHAQLATANPLEEILQFDVTAIHMRQRHNPGSFELNKEGQKIVQLLLGQEIIGDKRTMTIKKIEVVERKDRVEPLTMPCGKKAIVKTEFNPLQWDYYGKFGTTSRKMHVVLWRSGQFFEENALVLIILSVLLGGYSLGHYIYKKRQQCAIALKEADDAEAALLAPPAYTDEAQYAEQKDEDASILTEVVDDKESA